MQDVKHLLAPLEDAIKNKFLPALIGRPISDLERELIALPVRFGGLGISNPQHTADIEYKNSIFLTKDLTNQIYNQDQNAKADITIMNYRKKLIKQEKEKEHQRQFEIIQKDHRMTENQKKLLELSREKGAGAWLTAPPIQSLGYAFNKEDFRGSLCIRYGWRIKNMPLYCACAKKNDIDHSLSCKLGGYVIFRHDRIRDTTAEILKEICRDVRIEPELTPIDSDNSNRTSTNTKDRARLDVSCVGLWSPLERTFLDIRIFHPGAISYKNKSLQSLYKMHQTEKKQKYNSRIINMEKSTFTPVVFSTHGGMASESRALFQRAAKLISEKRKEQYADVMGYISTRLRISMMKSVLLSVRGSRGSPKGSGKPMGAIPFNMVPRDLFAEDL